MSDFFKVIGYFLLSTIVFIYINIAIDSSNPCSNFYSGGGESCYQSAEE